MSEWIGKLGAVNQYRDVDYVEKDGAYYRCLLCSTGGMHKNVVSRHFNGSGHASRYHYVVEMEIERLRMRSAWSKLQDMKTLETRVDSLGSSIWRLHVKELMFDHVSSEIVPTQKFYLAKLEAYEQMERISLLELAIWKSKICDGLVFSSVLEMREYSVLEENFDSKEYAKNLRITSGCAIIIPRVLEFLA